MASNIPAVFGLNKYLWAKLREAGLMDGAGYGGLIPIIPNQETPLLEQAIDAVGGIKSLPYIVYNWYENSNYEDWFMQCDNVMYRVYAPNLAVLRKIVLLIGDLFRRWDQSAQAANAWVRENLSDEFLDYDYKYINIQSVSAPYNSTAEDQPISQLVTIKVEFSNSQADNPLPGSLGV